LRQETILSGKRRFKEIRTQLGLDLQAYPNKSLNFLQKLNNLLQANLANTQAPLTSLSLPFRKTANSA